jgi:hypothetical protein
MASIESVTLESVTLESADLAAADRFYTAAVTASRRFYADCGLAVAKDAGVSPEAPDRAGS